MNAPPLVHLCPEANGEYLHAEAAKKKAEEVSGERKEQAESSATPMIGLDEEGGRLRRRRRAESDTGAANLIVSNVSVDRSATSPLQTSFVLAHRPDIRASARPRMVQARLVAKVNTGPNI
uniref:Uncharacterized protein n=1 Tax=Plectus sambesii TaxID=2011161 RepID=A0A914UI23_9BILA